MGGGSIGDYVSDFENRLEEEERDHHSVPFLSDDGYIVGSDRWGSWCC